MIAGEGIAGAGEGGGGLDIAGALFAGLGYGAGGWGLGMVSGSPVLDRRLEGRGWSWELLVVVGMALVVVIVGAVWGAARDSAAGGADLGTAVEAVVLVEAEARAGERAAVEAAPVGLPAEAVVPASMDSAGSAEASQIGLSSSLEQYQVQRGDTLAGLAVARGLLVADVLIWNRHLEVDSVLIRGEWLWLPAESAEGSVGVDRVELGQGGG